VFVEQFLSILWLASHTQQSFPELVQVSFVGLLLSLEGQKSHHVQPKESVTGNIEYFENLKESNDIGCFMVAL